ncbi:MAG: NusG domain II-containing protein [Oscillospiraceae bacterium]
MKSETKLRKSDIILCIAIVVVSIGMLIAFAAFGGEKGETAVITVGSKKYGEYPLNEDKEIKISTDSGYNVVQIRNGKVTMLEADCPDKYCVKQSSVSKTGESIVCLPHRLVIEIKSSKNSDIDAVT